MGTTEVLVILVAALVLFGPRKLPELSRSLGKSLNEFKRASEDFKRTWEQEVSADEATHEAKIERAMIPEDNSTMRAGEASNAAMLPTAGAATTPNTLMPAAADATVARTAATPYVSVATEPPQSSTQEIAGDSSATNSATTQSLDAPYDIINPSGSGAPSSTLAPQRKRDWL
ncbi:MAG: twin-arginine translocase TatA/TatE family subunit [Pyrinomonadaceae bacterium]